MRASIHQIYFRLLETTDEAFPYSADPIPPSGRWPIYGLDLPNHVLVQIYRNKLAVFSGSVEIAGNPAPGRGPDSRRTPRGDEPMTGQDTSRDAMKKWTGSGMKATPGDRQHSPSRRTHRHPHAYRGVPSIPERDKHSFDGSHTLLTNPPAECTGICRALGSGAIQWISKRRLVSLFSPSFCGWHCTGISGLWMRPSSMHRVLLRRAAAVLARSGRHQRVVLAIHFQTSQADEWARKGEIPERGRVYRSIRQFETEVVQQVDAIVFVSPLHARTF